MNGKGRDPIPKGHVVPVQRAMQGHPESPRLWEKHADKILRGIGLVPTTHEPCLYSGTILGNRVLFKRQVDDFAVATTDKRTADHLFDLIDDRLSMPLKRQGLITMFNGMDIKQTKDYIKVSCETYIERMAEKHLQKWMSNHHIHGSRPTPLPTTQSFVKPFLSTTGDPDVKVQKQFTIENGF